MKQERPRYNPDTDPAVGLALRDVSETYPGQRFLNGVPDNVPDQIAALAFIAGTLAKYEGKRACPYTDGGHVARWWKEGHQSHDERRRPDWKATS